MDSQTLPMVKQASLLFPDSDPNFYEKDLKVDKKILRVMETANNFGQGGNDYHPALGEFIAKISRTIGVHVESSNSIRDRQGNEIPVLKVKAKNQKSLEVASALIMEKLDPHRDKMTFNIDVPYNDHSYIIGKDGTRIKNLSRNTGCHIHLPDCNKTSSKKSNKLSIAGTDFTAIDQARDQIRKSLPLNIGFKALIKCGKFVIIDTASAEVQAVKRKYRVDVTFTNAICNTKYPEVTINVKGSRAQLEEIESATQELYHYVTDEKLSNNPHLVFAITIDVSHSHHQYVKGKNNCNLKVINQRSGATILFPPNESGSNQVVIQSKNLLSTVMGWQELMGYLPLLLSFDVNFDINNHYAKLQRLEKDFGVGIRTREKLSGHVYTVLIKTQERHSTYLQEIRQRILNFKNETDYKPTDSTISNLVHYVGYKNLSTNTHLHPTTIDHNNNSTMINNAKTLLSNVSLNSILSGDEPVNSNQFRQRARICERCGQIHDEGVDLSWSNESISGNSSSTETMPMYQRTYNPFNYSNRNGYVDNFDLPNFKQTLNNKHAIDDSAFQVLPFLKQAIKWPITNAENGDFIMQLRSHSITNDPYHGYNSHYGFK